MTAVLPKVQQSSWEHITTLTDNQPHNTFQNFYVHVGHIVRLQSGLSWDEHNNLYHDYANFALA